MMRCPEGARKAKAGEYGRERPQGEDKPLDLRYRFGRPNEKSR